MIPNEDVNENHVFVIRVLTITILIDISKKEIAYSNVK